MTRKELDVLHDTMSELKAFESKLMDLITECSAKKQNVRPSRKRSAVKRAALDLKEQLSQITTATGPYGTYYYKD